MNDTALSSLPADWQEWIASNLARACNPMEMADVMVRDGCFDRSLVNAAIAEARGVQLAALPMPDIESGANYIETADGRVEVHFAQISPRIVLLGNVLSEEECDTLSAYCTPRLVRSPVVDDGDGSMQLHPGRTSRGALLQRGETALIRKIESRLSSIAHWPVGRSEGLQVQHYEPGNEYQPHFDWFDPALPGPCRQMERGGQRLATFVLYLNDVEGGGGTKFSALGLEVFPKKGSALFFQNTDNQYQPDRRTLHAGTPVTSGLKTIANKWLRAHDY